VSTNTTVVLNIHNSLHFCALSLLIIQYDLVKHCSRKYHWCQICNHDHQLSPIKSVLFYPTCRLKLDWLYLILFRSYIVSCSRSYVVSCSRSHIVSCSRLYMVFYARLYIVSCLRLYIVSYSNHTWYLVLDRTWYLAQYGMLHHVQDCTFYHV
jgi:hypothetical protein